MKKLAAAVAVYVGAGVTATAYTAPYMLVPSAGLAVFAIITSAIVMVVIKTGNISAT